MHLKAVGAAALVVEADLAECSRGDLAQVVLVSAVPLGQPPWWVGKGRMRAWPVQPAAVQLNQPWVSITTPFKGTAACSAGGPDLRLPPGGRLAVRPSASWIAASCLTCGNGCYHAGMAKTQLGARVDEDVAELARKRAADLGLSIGDYLARLVQDDTSGLRARAVDAAARFLAEHQSVFDDAEDAQQPPRGAHAA